MANITLDIQSELPKAIRWTDAMTKQLPFAISQALNASAFDARTALNGSTRQYFDRPNRFTQSAFLVQKTNKRELEAIVYANAQQGRDRARYLRYGIQGGERRQKGFEKKFLAEIVGTRTIPSNAQLVPTSLVKLDGSGNVSLSTIKRIQKGLSGKARGGFFIGQPRNNPGLATRHLSPQQGAAVPLLHRHHRPRQLQATPAHGRDRQQGRAAPLRWLPAEQPGEGPCHGTLRPLRVPPEQTHRG